MSLFTVSFDASETQPRIGGGTKTGRVQVVLAPDVYMYANTYDELVAFAERFLDMCTAHRASSPRPVSADPPEGGGTGGVPACGAADTAAGGNETTERTQP